MIYLYYACLFFWLTANLIVFIKWKPKEMWEDLVVDQNILGRIFGNIFYAPYWLAHIIKCLVREYIYKPTKKFLRFVFFAIARGCQVIYHAIFDML